MSFRRNVSATISRRNKKLKSRIPSEHVACNIFAVVVGPNEPCSLLYMSNTFPKYAVTAINFPRCSFRFVLQRQRLGGRDVRCGFPSYFGFKLQKLIGELHRNRSAQDTTTMVATSCNVWRFPKGDCVRYSLKIWSMTCVSLERVDNDLLQNPTATHYFGKLGKNGFTPYCLNRLQSESIRSSCKMPSMSLWKMLEKRSNTKTHEWPRRIWLLFYVRFRSNFTNFSN